MKRKLANAMCLMLLGWSVVLAAGWRAASEPELRKVIPARAPVIKENIETEFRTASGVTDGQGKFIAGVVMITAGYSAEGKYSHFFIAPMITRLSQNVKVSSYKCIAQATLELPHCFCSSSLLAPSL